MMEKSKSFLIGKLSKIFSIAVLFFSVFLLNGCENFNEEDPKNHDVVIKYLGEDLNGNYSVNLEEVIVNNREGYEISIEEKTFPNFIFREDNPRTYIITGEDNQEVIIKYDKDVGYTINFDGNGHTSGDTESQSVEYNQEIALTPNGFSRTGYRFIGWSTTSDGVVEYADQVNVLNLATGSITLYAVWEANTYTIIFDGNGATSGITDSQTVIYDQTVALNANGFNKTGYMFMGWGLSSDGTVQYNDEATVNNIVSSESITLYAIWQAATCMIQFDGNGHTDGNTESQISNYNEETRLNANGFSRTGYKFIGWSTTSTGSVEYNDQEDVFDLTKSNLVTLYAVWEAKAYSIFFSGNGHDTGMMEHQNVSYDQEVPLSANKFGKIGHTFQGWSTTTDGIVEYNDKANIKNLTISQSITLYAVWKANIYTIIFDGNGHDGGDTGNQTVHYNQVVTLNTNRYTKTGYTFMGWSRSSDGYIQYNDEATVSNVTESDSITLYAKWVVNSYIIIFDGNGANSGYTESQEIDYNEQARLNENGYGRTGHTFKGWSTTSSGSVQYTDKISVKNLVPSGTITLYAIWEAKTYTIIFNGNGCDGGYTENQTINYGKQVTLIPNGYTKTGYTFAGWSRSSDGNIQYNNEASVKNVTESDSVTLYAKWVANSYAIFFDGNGASVGHTKYQMIRYDEQVELNKNEYDRTGYTFKGWSTTINGNVEYNDKANIKNLAPSGTITLYAVWEVNSYTINFDGNGSTSGSTASQTINYDKQVALNANEFIKNGYTFIGWSTLSDGAVHYNDKASVKNLTTEASITLYAVWKVNNYTINFDGNGNDSGITPSQILEYEQELPLNANEFIKIGYTFKGWSTTSTGNVEYVDKANVKKLTVSTITLYAIWQVNTYTITFDGNGNDDGTTASQTINYDEIATLNENGFSKTGYTFKGWSKTEIGNVEYDDKSSVLKLSTGNPITLYAIWEENTYTIHFDGNGHTSGNTENQVIYYEDSVLLNLNQYTKIGYTFKGWSETETGNVKYNDLANVNKLIPSGTMTLFAVWEANKYTIDFNGNGFTGGSTQSQTVNYDEEVALTANGYNRDNHKFIGWSKTETGDVLYNDKASIKNLVTSGSITLYAVWAVGTHTINFNGNGYTSGSTASQVVEYGQIVTLNENGFSRDNHVFLGWSKTETGDVEYIDQAEVQNLTTGNSVTLYAVWAVSIYTITFNGNGHESGSTINQTVNYNEEVSLNANGYSKDGYLFIGWSTTSDGSVQYSDQANVKNLTTIGSITLYAVWAANSYEVNFNGNGHTSGSIANQTVDYDEQVALNANGFSRTGYTFAGWSTTSDGSIQYSDQAIIKNLTTKVSITLYAVWEVNTYTIIFDGNGNDGGNTENQIINYDEQVTLIPNGYTKTGYTFMGWSRSSDGYIQYNDEAIVKNVAESGSVTLYAKWGVNIYTITFDGNGHTSGSTASQTTNYDEGTTLNINGFIRTGYRFIGWSTTSTGNAEYNDQETVFRLTTSNAITLYAVWEAQGYTIYFNGNGSDAGNMQYQNVIYDQEVALKPNEFGRTGYNFKGWSTTSNGSVEYTDQKKIKNLTTLQSITLYAVWEANTYTVNFDGNGHTSGSTASQTINYDEQVALNANGYSKTGYTFIGWSTTIYGNVEYIDKASIKNLTTSGSITLYAIWTTKSYTVNFNGNGYTSGSTASQTINYDEQVALNANGFSKTGYTFIGWSITSDGSVQYNDQASVKNLTTETSITLYAVWTTKSYTVNFDGNGHTSGSTASQTINYDEQVALNANGFNKTGYTFIGWSITSDGSVQYSDQASVKNLTTQTSITLYAVWEANTYTIIFDGNGHTSGSTASQTINYDEQVALNTNGFIRTGYTFVGWNTASTGTAEYTDGASVKNLTTETSITLYAVWTTKSYTVNFDGNGHTSGSTASQTINYDELVSLIPNGYTKTGYTFMGWSRSSDGSVQYIDQASVKNLTTETSITLYAVWEANSYTVNFDGNGHTSGNTVSQTINYDEQVALNANGFNKTGYTFIGWSITSDGSVQYSDQASVKNLTTQTSITLYAVWEANSYTVNFHGNGHTSGNTLSQTIDYDEQVALNTNGFIRTGYTFVGWNTASTGTAEYTDGASVKNLTTETSITLYAIWEGNTYTINFNRNGSDAGSMASQTAKYGQQVSLNPNGFSKTGYTFIGWSTTSTGNVKYTDKANTNNLTTESSITLYAIWKANTYIITFDGNGHTGGNTTSQTVTYDEEITLTANGFSKTGYKFVGWSTTSTGNVKYVDQASVSNITIESSITLYAVWEKTHQKITFNLNEGTLPSGYSTIIYVSNQLFPYVLPTPTKIQSGEASYEFLGWYETNSTEGTKVDVLSELKDYTLYAQWNTDVVYYKGEYPQSRVTNSSLLTELNKLTPQTSSKILTTSQGTAHTEVWYTINYGGYKFEKVGDKYYKYEPIAFYKLADGTYYSKHVIDYSPFDEKVDNETVTNNYHNSYVRKYLNEVIKTKAGINSTLGLLSKAQLSNTTNFADDNARAAQTTSYGFGVVEGGRGKITSFSVNYFYFYNKHYWTNTPSTYSKYVVNRVNGDGIFLDADCNHAFGLRITIPKTYTIEFRGNGSDSGSTETQIVEYGMPTPLNMNGFARECYAFVGWSTTYNGDVEYEDGAIITDLTTENITYLYAKWERIAVKITFNLNGGTLPEGYDTVMMIYNTEFPYTLPIPEKAQNGEESYEFLGWSYSSSPTGNKIYVLETPSTSTLHAHWGSVYYKGEYPQTKVMDETLIIELNKLTPQTSSKTLTTSQGKSHTETWYTVTYSGIKYEKVGTDYYKYEPIKFYRLSDGTYYSGFIIDYSPFDEYTTSVVTNIYNNSYIKKYLNEVIKAKTGFTSLIGILSNEELSNTTNFANGAARRTTSTEYATAIYQGARGKITFGSYSSSYLDNYWTSTPSADNGNLAYVVNKYGTQSASNNRTSRVLGLRMTIPGTYTINFDGNGSDGGNTASQIAPYDQEVQLNANGFTRTDYTFIGWSTTSTGDCIYDDQALVTNLTTLETVTLYAKWIRNPKTITFHLNDGSLPEGYQTTMLLYEANLPYTLPIPTKAPNGEAHYEFIGWYPSNTIIFDNKIEVLNEFEDYTLYAKWDEVYYIGEYPQTKVIDSALIIELDKLTPQTSSKTLTTSRGKSHTETWYTVTYSGIKYEKVDTDYYKYEPIAFCKTADGTYYSRHILDYSPFDELGNDSTITNIYNNSYVRKYITEVVKPKTGLDFLLGLFSKEQLNNSDDFPWNAHRKAVSTDYSNMACQGGRGKIPSSSFLVSYNINYLNTYWTNSPSTALYRTLNVKDNGSVVPNSQGASTHEVLGLRITIPTGYTITFNGNGYTSGSTPKQIVKYNESEQVQLNANGFLKTGYTFKGWSTTATGEVEYNDEMVIESPLADELITLYAVWEANTYTIIFNGNGHDGGITPNQNMTYDQALALHQSNFYKENYKFIGWSTTATGNVIYENKEIVINLTTSGSITLYAVWLLGKQITLNLNGGTLPSGYKSVMFIANSDFPYTLPIPTKTDGEGGVYEFFGWYDNHYMHYGNKLDELTEIKDYTLYAHWTEYPVYYQNEYPQTKVTDQALITELNKLTPETSSKTLTTSQNTSNVETWNTVTYSGNKYEKLGSDYYKYEPIAFYKLPDGTYYSRYIIDYSPFDEYGSPTIQTNKYDDSYVRKYLKEVMRTKSGIDQTLGLLSTDELSTYNKINKATSTDYASAVLLGGRGEITSFEVSYDDSYLNYYYTNTSYTHGTQSAYCINADGNKTNYICYRVLGLRVSIPRTYIITFEGNGHDSGSTQSQTVYYHERVPLNANGFSKSGHTFMGWSTTSTGNVEYIDEENIKNLTNEVGGEVTLYAVWEEHHTVNVILNGGALPGGGNVINVPISEFPFIMPRPTKTTGSYHREFLGWYTENSTEGTRLDVLSTLQTYTLYALWGDEPLYYIGEYPQTKITDAALIAILDELTPQTSTKTLSTSQPDLSNTETWYTVSYKGYKFEKLGSNYFKYEPIAFYYRIDTGLHYTKYIIDYSPFDVYVFPASGYIPSNNYNTSYVKGYLNQVLKIKAGVTSTVRLLLETDLNNTANFADVEAKKATSTEYAEEVFLTHIRHENSTLGVSYKTSSYLNTYWTGTPSKKTDQSHINRVVYVLYNGNYGEHYYLIEHANYLFGLRCVFED